MKEEWDTGAAPEAGVTGEWCGRRPCGFAWSEEHDLGAEGSWVEQWMEGSALMRKISHCMYISLQIGPLSHAQRQNHKSHFPSLMSTLPGHSQ